MSALTTHFSDHDLAHLGEGIRRFIRLMGLIHDPDPRVWGKWLADEDDLKLALRSVARAFEASQPMVGKRKYQGIDYDAPKLVLKDITSYMLVGDTDSESALLRRRNQPMYYLVIEPLVQLFYKVGDHQAMIDNASAICNAVAEMVDAETDYGSYDDALVARFQVQQIIQARDAERTAERESKRKRRKRDPTLELLAAFGVDGSEELDESLI